MFWLKLVLANVVGAPQSSREITFHIYFSLKKPYKCDFLPSLMQYMLKLTCTYIVECILKEQTSFDCLNHDSKNLNVPGSVTLLFCILTMNSEIVIFMSCGNQTIWFYKCFRNMCFFKWTVFCLLDLLVIISFFKLHLVQC